MHPGSLELSVAESALVDVRDAASSRWAPPSEAADCSC